ncbi:NUDIX domain-containing protein [Streptomyces sp. NPDC059980]|uniref:NUDIX domain-containing protein n=1 Tax=Streptomyces sp. NPDC059980 TaxID=3347022 RepID=UPI00369F8F80
MTRPSVSLVGSFRQHYPQVVKAAQTFTDAGFTVESPPISPIVKHGQFVRFECDPPLSSDHAIQAATLKKIFTSDFVYVVNPGGYIGRTTAYELGCVNERGMAVFYAEPPDDLPIEVPEGTVVSPEDLVHAINGTRPVPVRRPRVAALPTADIVIFTIRSQRLHVLLVKRGTDPFRGKLALPGGFVRPGESLEDTAMRELKEETGLSTSSFSLRQMHTYSRPQRDPRGRIVTTAFLAIAPNLPEVTGATDAYKADWVEVEESLWSHSSSLAFDHGLILQRGLEQVRQLLERTTSAVDFCGDLFTISDLREVYEAVWGIKLNPQNFQRKVRKTTGFLAKTNKKRTSRPGAPAELFRRGSAKLLYPPMMRTSHRGEPGGEPSGGRAAPAAVNRRVPHSRRKDITGRQVPR